MYCPTIAAGLARSGLRRPSCEPGPCVQQDAFVFGFVEHKVDCILDSVRVRIEGVISAYAGPVDLSVLAANVDGDPAAAFIPAGTTEQQPAAVPILVRKTPEEPVDLFDRKIGSSRREQGNFLRRPFCAFPFLDPGTQRLAVDEEV